MARKAGTPNKMNKAIKEVFEKVFHDLQRDKHTALKTWATDNKTEFYKIASRFIPLTVAGEVEHKISKIEVVLKDE